MDEQTQPQPKTLRLNERWGTVIAILLGMMLSCVILCVLTLVWAF